LSHLITSKYLDHVPLHRMEGILARQGIEYPRSTRWEQIRACGLLMIPLYKVAIKEVLASRILGTDDTPVNVLDSTRTKARTGNVWTYVGDEAHPLIVYDYTPGRARKPSRGGPVPAPPRVISWRRRSLFAERQLQGPGVERVADLRIVEDRDAEGGGRLLFCNS